MTTTGSTLKTQMSHLTAVPIKHQRSSSSPPNNNVISPSSTPSSTSNSPFVQSPQSPLSPSSSKSTSPLNKLVKQTSSDDNLKSSFDQLKDALGDYEFDGEVIIKDVDSEDEYDEEEYEDEEEQVYEDDGANGSMESIEEEEEVAIIKSSSSPPTRGYSYSISSSSPSMEKSFGRHERSESTIIHPDAASSPIPKINITNNNNSSPIKPNINSSSTLGARPIGSPITIKQSDKANVVKEAISSEYKKMMDNPDEFRASKLKQRKSKFFSKDEIESFHPSSGTQMKSKFYKQFIEEKSVAIYENVEKYKTDLIKNYILELTTNRNSGPISFGNVKPLNNSNISNKSLKDQAKNKLLSNHNSSRNRSYSQPPELTSIVNKPLSGLTMESVITRENNRDGKNNKVPLLVTKCIEYLSNEDALKTEGLFRVAGNQSEVETLMKSLLQHGYDIPSGCCVHVVSSTLKKFLRQLQVPTFTFKYHHDFLNKLKITNEYERMVSMRKLLIELPEYNQKVINQVIKFLNLVTKYSTSNMMHAHNLGLMFGPTMMKAPDETEMSIMLDSSSQVITYLIENYSQVYND